MALVTWEQRWACLFIGFETGDVSEVFTRLFNVIRVSVVGASGSCLPTPSSCLSSHFILVFSLPSPFSVLIMLLTPLDDRSFPYINAWLEDTHSAISKAHHHRASDTQKGTSLASCVTEKAMGSSKRNADYDKEEMRTPKRLQTFTDPDDTPRNTRLIRHDYLDTLDSPATSTDSIMQSSKSNKSSRVSSIKNLSSLLMTKNPVERSENISEIPSMGQDLYHELSRCGHAQGILPSAPKVCVVV